MAAPATHKRKIQAAGGREEKAIHFLFNSAFIFLKSLLFLINFFFPAEEGKREKKISAAVAAERGTTQERDHLVSVPLYG